MKSRATNRLLRLKDDVCGRPRLNVELPLLLRRRSTTNSMATANIAAHCRRATVSRSRAARSTISRYRITFVRSQCQALVAKARPGGESRAASVPMTAKIMPAITLPVTSDQFSFDKNDPTTALLSSTAWSKSARPPVAEIEPVLTMYTLSSAFRNASCVDCLSHPFPSPLWPLGF